MNAPTYEYRRRYEVQIASTISTITGRDMQGRWEFCLAFHDLADAQAAAERLSEDNRWVRVVDTQNEEAS
ncbi:MULTISPECIES: hypothetical protein [unclassified Microbacterium]|uniref:hypothetical protein n=1 Tax=unclassified Microbacterium TaxID=2609290 RepID=UPI0024697140|nr:MULTISPECIES: hypothetical protein [unclassified Microbacterium]MDH5134048.1 hypothetical protein [Microbacterium sp. RD10]MDH5136848.1 hypothetical protein [Microbacterium sp. RD11]MDH5146888.1 hypothetical protein [Microbacterium sp. RD12]MDH5156586.1 hypothetical protein [Microbacterium sp. RD06]MDH5168075.1 hypothetical protein [Microbacterium sp. RD02]